MKRYFFEPGAIECHRRRSALTRMKRRARAVKGWLLSILDGNPSDSIGCFVLLAACTAACAACLGMLAGVVQAELGMGVFR